MCHNQKGFIMRINTNVSSLVAQESSVTTSKTLSTSLENIPAGIYELTITDEKGILAGEFIYEN